MPQKKQKGDSEVVPSAANAKEKALWVNSQKPLPIIYGLKDLQQCTLKRFSVLTVSDFEREKARAIPPRKVLFPIVLQ